jgi:hypothetical protein
MPKKTAKSKPVKKAVTPKVKKSTSKVAVKSFKQDSKQTESLIKAGKVSATQAIRESKALELSITFMEKGVLFKEAPDGKKTIIKKPSKKRSTSITLKKGMILYAKG